MSDSPASRNEAPISKLERILVWDVPVRVFHWLMVVSFIGAYATGESERWRLAHVTLGYTMAGLVAFRILWGLLGTRYALFSNFVKSPAVIWTYMRGIVSGRHEKVVGHNPAGGVAIVTLLLLAIAVSASGWSAYTNGSNESMEGLHEVAANLMLAVIVVHVLGVVLGSFLQRENLIVSMVTGQKSGAKEDGIRASWRGLGVLLLALSIAFWWVQWNSAPAGGISAGDSGASTNTKAHDDD